jgi:hypothetical protein
MAATGTRPWGYWKCAAAECGYQTSGARSEVSGRVENICSRGADCPATEEFSEVAVYDDGRVEFGPSHVKVGGAPEAAPPATNGGAKGALPDDFPGRSALSDAGVNTYAQLRKAGDVTALPGIGSATEAKIAAALDAADKGATP